MPTIPLRPDTPLNANHEAFCRALAGGASQAQAYVDAGYNISKCSQPAFLGRRTWARSSGYLNLLGNRLVEGFLTLLCARRPAAKHKSVR